MRRRCSATSLGLRFAPSNCCAWAVISGVSAEVRGPREARKTLHAAGAIGIDATNDAVLRHAESAHDIDLAADALADELGGEHSERTAVVLSMLKYRVGAAEVCPLAVFAYDTDQVANARGTVGDERQ